MRRTVKLIYGFGLSMLLVGIGLGPARSSELVVTKICESRCTSSWRYTAYKASFKPKEFWKQSMKTQLLNLQDAIQECDLMKIMLKYQRPLKYTDMPYLTCLKPTSFSSELEEHFEEAIWKILRKDYKISFDRFKKSLRLNLSPLDHEYSAPLLIHFKNQLVPRYEFHYKNEQCLKDNIPYKTIKLPSMFEVAIGRPDVGTVVYEAK